MAAKIVHVDPGSPADRSGVRPGELLVSINGNPIRDVLDYKFYSYDPRLVLQLQAEDGTLREVRIKKPEGLEPGIDFENYLMDKAKSCSNHCVFCFIDQLPRGMRKTLYFKDDDARLSFLLGNYISLTNLSEEDVERMIRMHVSPVNVSVQTTNPELRIKMLRNPKAGEALKIMDRFAQAHITMNCQLVICKGLNDGEELKRSLYDLEKLFPSVSSISVVPFGMTRHRKNLYPLEPMTAEDAADIIRITEDFAAHCLQAHGTRLAFCGDELYIKARIPFPDVDYYEEFTQFENGVGMMSLFMRQFRRELPWYEGKSARPFCIATGTAAAPFFAKLIDEAKGKCDNLKGEVYTITNYFFGEGVSVAGLLTGQDLIRGLQGKDLGERVLISANMLRDGGDVFLDDYTLGQVSDALGVPVVPVDIDGMSLLEQIFEE